MARNLSDAKEQLETDIINSIQRFEADNPDLIVKTINFYSVLAGYYGGEGPRHRRTLDMKVEVR